MTIVQKFKGNSDKTTLPVTASSSNPTTTGTPKASLNKLDSGTGSNNVMESKSKSSKLSPPPLSSDQQMGRSSLLQQIQGFNKNSFKSKSSGGTGKNVMKKKPRAKRGLTFKKKMR